MYKTIILPAVLHGCETWCLTLKEEHRLREFENRVLRTIFAPMTDKGTGGWRKLHNEELVTYTLRQVYLERSSQVGWDGQAMQHKWGRKRSI
jgi:hypothetical protein